MQYPSCLCAMGLCIPPPNFRMPEPIFMKLGMYVMAPAPISMAYVVNPSHQSVCIPFIIIRQRLCKNVTAVTNTRNNRRIVWHSIFYAVPVVSKASRGLVLPRTSCTMIVLYLQTRFSPSCFSKQIVCTSTGCSERKLIGRWLTRVIKTENRAQLKLL
jgi:hypothetical protein